MKQSFEHGSFRYKPNRKTYRDELKAKPKQIKTKLTKENKHPALAMAVVSINKLYVHASWIRWCDWFRLNCDATSIQHWITKWKIECTENAKFNRLLCAPSSLVYSNALTRHASPFIRFYFLLCSLSQRANIYHVKANVQWTV